jgi:hypothetical protein
MKTRLPDDCVVEVGGLQTLILYEKHKSGKGTV